MINQVMANPAVLKPSTSKTDAQKLKDACTEFEAIMVKEMLEQMQGNTQIFGKGFGGEFYQGMFLDVMSKQIANQGLGLARMLNRQLEKTDNVPVKG